MWHRDDEVFDEKMAATAAPGPSAGERRNRELRQHMSDRGGDDVVFIGQEASGARKLIPVSRAKANAVPHLGLERLRVRDKGWLGCLFASCEDEYEDGSYCGFRSTVRAIHAYFFEEPPADNVDAFGFRIEEWDKAGLDRARATRWRWQCIRLVFLFVVVTAIVTGSVFVDELRAKERALAMEQQAEFDERIQAKIDRLTPPDLPPPNWPPTNPYPPPEPPSPPPPFYQFASIEEAREVLAIGGTDNVDFNKLAGKPPTRFSRFIVSPHTR